jgi:hypothetical protein
MAGKSKHRNGFRPFHLDKRIPAILAADIGDPNERLNTEETAHVLGVSKVWLEKRRADGRGPPHEGTGRATTYRRSTRHKWLKERQRIVQAASGDAR